MFPDVESLNQMLGFLITHQGLQQWDWNVPERNEGTFLASGLGKAGSHPAKSRPTGLGIRIQLLKRQSGILHPQSRQYWY